MAQREAKTSVAKTVRDYIDRHPVVRDALAMDLINLSALSRRIMDETGLTQEEAVLVACRRHQSRKQTGDYEAGIRRVLTRSQLEVRNRVAVLTLRSSWKLFARLEKMINKLHGRNHPTHLLHGSEAITVITDESILGEIEALLEDDDVIRRRTGLVQLNLRSPDVVEDVPGILAFVASSLARQGINFIDVISCHKDNMFLVEEKDLIAAFQVLNPLLR